MVSSLPGRGVTSKSPLANNSTIVPSANVIGVPITIGMATPGFAGSKISVTSKFALSPSGSSSPSKTSTTTGVSNGVSTVSSSATGGI